MVSRLLVFILGTVCCAVALAGTSTMSLAEYMAVKRRLATELQSAKSACGAQTSDRRDVCMVDAMGKDWIAKADLEVAYRSRPRSRAEASLARVDARFWLDRERCDEAMQRDRLGCLQQAKTVRVAGRTEVEVQLKAEEMDETCAGEAAASDRIISQACKSGAGQTRRRIVHIAPQ